MTATSGASSIQLLSADTPASEAESTFISCSFSSIAFSASTKRLFPSAITILIFFIPTAPFVIG